MDDEDFILAKEHGTAKLAPPEEDANSRGDADQNPVIMEVHEFNPERRFVIMENRPIEIPKDSKEAPTNEKMDAKPTITTEPLREGGNSRVHLNPEKTTAVKRDGKPSLERRRSRQDLPVLDTEFTDRRESQHHRSRSAVNAPRPDYFTPSQNGRQYGDTLLSPEPMVRYRSGREYSQFASSPTRDSYSSRDRLRDSRSASGGRRSGHSHDKDEYRRPVSIDRRTADHSLGDDSVSRGKAPSSHSSREHSQAKDSATFDRHPPAYQKPIITQNSLKPEPDRIVNERTSRHRSPSRSNTTPIPAPIRVAPLKKQDSVPISATVRPTHGGDFGASPPLPYPEDGFKPASVNLGSVGARDDKKKPDTPMAQAFMPEIPRIAPEVAMTPKADRDTSPIPSGTGIPNGQVEATWKPPPFDPNKDGVNSERPVGSYRRYSENRGKGQNRELPECPRANPVSGKMDWITLPRSDFNICPDCYGAVFADTSYRTHFQPMLRPTNEAISCDFGSSPWYRIAWLLVLKQKSSDLRLFHNMAHVMQLCKDDPCPKHRRSVRSWYTVRDPSTRRPVPEFQVCYQCAKTVETLLPNLAGVFVPVDSRSEPSKGSCSLHFAPHRKEFILFFDAFETTSDRADASKKVANVSDLTKSLERLTTHNECREDRPVSDGYWHYMQYLPQFTVCADCFDDVVKPRLGDDNLIARNFYIKPQKLPVATCQLYSSRMRSIFNRACQRNDPLYLEEKVRERMRVEADIHGQLVKLDQRGKSDARTEERVDRLIQEWKKWE